MSRIRIKFEQMYSAVRDEKHKYASSLANLSQNIVSDYILTTAGSVDLIYSSGPVAAHGHVSVGIR